MTSVGETLRAERLKRNLALDQISRELKISPRFLDAIESSEFEKLPGGVFTKSFVRQYARLLGLDEEELAGEVQRMLEPAPAVPQHAPSKPSGEAAFHVPKMEEWESVGEKRFRWSGSLSAAAFLVVVLLICSGVYTWLQRPRNATPVETTAAQPAPQTQTPAAAVPAAIQPSQPQPASPTETASAPAPQPGSETVPPVQVSSPSLETTTKVARTEGGGAVRVEVTAEEPVWILARADGKYAFSGTLEANQSRTVEAADTILLRLGNAGGVSITFNGKPIGPVGPKGQVRNVQFTSGGFQIVPAKPPAVLDPL